jgi:hypothetical protein
MFYCVDTKTGKRTSLHTSDKDEALQIILAKNQAQRQPVLNLQIAKAYLAGTDSGVSTRTWQDAMEILIDNKHGSNQEHWRRAVPDKAFDLIRHRTIIETKGELLLKVLHTGTVSTNIFLQFLRGHELAASPLIPKRQ